MVIWKYIKWLFLSLYDHLYNIVNINFLCMFLPPKLHSAPLKMVFNQYLTAILNKILSFCIAVNILV